MRQLSPEIHEEVTRRIVDAIHPEQIILFGSYSWGRPTDDSDVDLFAIFSHSDQPGYRRARDIYRSLRGLKVPVEVVVRTREEVERGKTVKTSLERKILKDGRVLHGMPDPGVEFESQCIEGCLSPEAMRGSNSR